ncbi:MAG TPA: ABC transporter substrate-binding protein [Casimicrobiaceae bacterium]|jgi:ABC-type nitrate/sulfonate/bicarbonate transport system substrate-binding protein
MTIRILCVCLAGLCLTAGGAAAQAPQRPLAPVRVISFDGGWNLPVWAAQRQGFFEANGVAVQTTYTPSSGFLIASLFDGRQDVALALMDNLIAYQEGQGEVKLLEPPDLVAILGGDGGFLSVVAAPAVKSFADLKGKTLSVDALTTGAAFVLRELVAKNGLAEGEVNYVRAGGTSTRYTELLAGKHDATLLRTPFEVLAQNRGFHVLASADTLGPYQGTVGFVRRSWALAHDAAVVGFIKGYRAGAEWIYQPANREIVEALLVANIRDMTPALARQSYDLLLAQRGGIYRDARPDLAGIGTVLALRSKYAIPAKTLSDPARYVDLSFYDKAFPR